MTPLGPGGGLLGRWAAGASRLVLVLQLVARPLQESHHKDTPAGVFTVNQTIYTYIIINNCMYIYMYLVGGIPTPLKNMSSSVGVMKFPIYGKS